MGKFVFRDLQPAETGEVLPDMFDILYTNMTAIAPTGASCEEDKALWLSFITPALAQGKVQVILMLAGETLAGYLQYSIRGDTLLVEEVEIRKDFQRTMLFYRCCMHLLHSLPTGIRYLESYVNKQNTNSLTINQKLGMEIIGENKSGSSWHLRGDAEKTAKRFIR